MNSTAKPHIEAIEAALDAFADDTSIPLAEYAEAMEEIAYEAKTRAQAALEDLAN